MKDDQNLMIYSEHKLKERSIFIVPSKKKKDLDTIENNIASKGLRISNKVKLSKENYA